MLGQRGSEQRTGSRRRAPRHVHPELLPLHTTSLLFGCEARPIDQNIPAGGCLWRGNPATHAQPARLHRCRSGARRTRPPHKRLLGPHAIRSEAAHCQKWLLLLTVRGGGHVQPWMRRPAAFRATWAAAGLKLATCIHNWGLHSLQTRGKQCCSQITIRFFTDPYTIANKTRQYSLLCNGRPA
jgi:hypothetical protein